MQQNFYADEHERHLDPLTIAATVLEKLKPVQKAISAVKKFAGNLGIGGVSDDRFINNRNAMIKILYDNGYVPNLNEAPNKQGQNIWAIWKVRHVDIPNRKTSGSYEPEYKRLEGAVREILNLKNPGLGSAGVIHTGGLGDYWALSFPLTMANLGGIYKESIDALRVLCESYKPGTYTGQLGPPKMPVQEVTTKEQGVTPAELQERVDSANQVQAGIFPSFNGVSGDKILIIVVVIVILIIAAKFAK